MSPGVLDGGVSVDVTEEAETETAVIRRISKAIYSYTVTTGRVQLPHSIV